MRGRYSIKMDSRYQELFELISSGHTSKLELLVPQRTMKTINYTRNEVIVDEAVIDQRGC